jgi:ESS family glutamate:Na+ symporter
MEFSVVDGLRLVKFDLVYTLALAALVLFVGYGLQRRVSFLSKTSIPAAAIGGLLFALLVWFLRSREVFGVGVDATLRAPLQTVFFTTIGLGATLSLLRAGGWRMIFFLLIVSVTALVQNGVGIALAKALGAPAPLGVICGALTLTGGPATGLARAADFEALGIKGANALIIASATFGIFFASIVGNPVAVWLIRRFGLSGEESEEKRQTEEENSMADGKKQKAKSKEQMTKTKEQRTNDEEQRTNDEDQRPKAKDQRPITTESFLRSLLLLLVIMGLGAVVSFGLTKLSAALPGPVGALLKLPGYIGAMIVAALFRNLNERFCWVEFDAKAFEVIGAISLALFLAIALMDLKLWELAGLALPMIVILTVQIFVMIAYAVFVTFVLMGRDYEAAVTTSGHIGFGLGITPNAVANMEALTARFGPAPRSFLIAPVVGAFFIDFTNALIINLFINFLR